MLEELHRHRRGQKKSPFVLFLRAYWVEIFIVIGLLLAIFLIFERMQIRVTLLGWLREAVSAGFNFIGHLDDAAVSFFSRVGLSELMSIPLLIVVFAALAWRVRWRLQRTPALTDLHCPRCGGSIHRAHRHFLDHVLSIFVLLRRYHCTNRDCRWSGVRVSMHSHQGRPRMSPG